MAERAPLGHWVLSATVAIHVFPPSLPNRFNYDPQGPSTVRFQPRAIIHTPEGDFVGQPGPYMNTPHWKQALEYLTESLETHRRGGLSHDQRCRTENPRSAPRSIGVGVQTQGTLGGYRYLVCLHAPQVEFPSRAWQPLSDWLVGEPSLIDAVAVLSAQITVRGMMDVVNEIALGAETNVLGEWMWE